MARRRRRRIEFRGIPGHPRRSPGMTPVKLRMVCRGTAGSRREAGKCSALPAGARKYTDPSASTGHGPEHLLHAVGD